MNLNVAPAWRSSSELRSFAPQRCPLLLNQSEPRANNKEKAVIHCERTFI